MPAPQVSVILATYNWPSVLKLAIQTVLEQTFTDFELLVVGDGCTDETEAVVRAFQDSRVLWFNLPRNSGNQAVPNQFGLSQARAPLIAYLNHDDLWFPEHLASLVERYGQGDWDIIHSLSLLISPPGRNFREVLGLPWRDAHGRIDVHPMTTTVMHSAEAAKAVGGWRDWREVDGYPTQEFFRRMRERRRLFGVVLRLTALKFHSGDRPGSYKTKSDAEQAGYLRLMLTDPELRLRETLRAFACMTMGERHTKVAHAPRPADAPLGWDIEQLRLVRGLEPML